VSPKHLPATKVEGSTIRRRQTSTFDPEATHAPPPNQSKGEQKSNRESIRLETPATSTKHSIPCHSNREETALLKHRIRPALAEKGRLSPPATTAFWPSPRIRDRRKTSRKGEKRRKQHPPFLLRLKMHPILYFLQFARRFQSHHVAIKNGSKKEQGERKSKGGQLPSRN
jgi:hypothetical protein